MGGAGTGGVRKPLMDLAGQPLVRHTVRALLAAACVREVVLVGHPDDLGPLTRAVEGLGRIGAIVPGGAERTDSVRAGVAACAPDAEVIAVHDAARPFVEAGAIDAVCRAASADGGALLAAPVRDTLWWSEDGARAERTVDRERCFAAHTPQAFRADEFRALVERAAAEGLGATDDAGLWARFHGPPTLVADSPANFKLTTPADLALARALIEERPR